MLAPMACMADATPTAPPSPAGVAAEQLLGMPPIRNYSFDEIGNVSTSVELGCDSLGRLTLAQQGTFLAFDERRWQEQGNPQSLPIGWMKTTTAPDGTMYWCGTGDWGTYEYRPDGKIATRSLRGPDFPAWIANAVFTRILADRDNLLLWQFSGAVWHDLSTGRNRYLSLIKTSTAFLLNGQAYVSSPNHGLGTMDPESGAFVPVPGLAGLSGYFVETVEWDEGRILAAREDGGFVIFDGATTQPWPTQIDDPSGVYIRALWRLPEGRIAAAVRGRGIYILERDGRVALALDQPRFSDIHALISTEPGVLWATTRDGVVKVLYGVPFEIFDHQSGLDLSWPHLLTHRGRLLVWASGRLCEAVESAPGTATQFRPLELPPAAGGIAMGLSTPHGLLLATETGVWERNDAGETLPILTGLHAWRLVKGDAGGDSAIVIAEETTMVLRWNGQEWEQSGRSIPPIGYPSEMSVPVPGSAWIELGVNRIARVWLRDGQVQAQVFDHLADRTPDWLSIGSVGPLVVIRQGNGECRYFDERTETFVDAPELDRAFSQVPPDAARPRQDATGRIWLGCPQGVICLEPDSEGRYRAENDQYGMLRDAYPIVEILENGEVWTRSIHTLHRLDTSRAKATMLTPDPVLVRVTDTRQVRDLFSAQAEGPPQLRGIPYRSNSLAFHLFPGTHGLLRNVSYRCKLEGYADEWSEVDGSNLAFTNLKEGDYRLLAQALEGGRPVGDLATFVFSIAPPIYRTWYALLAYALAAGGALFAGRGWVLRQARLRQQELETQVRSRTQELKHANESLQSAVVTSQKATRAKDEFLARMSHEIRTPRNGVMGMIGELATTDLTPEQHEMCRVVEGSAESLMTIIDDILDFSKIESGKLKIDKQPLDLRQLINDTVALFAPRARAKDLALQTHLSIAEECWVLGDSVRLRQVLSNLLGNAVKFTARGSVSVRVVELEAERFRFEIADTGLGISDEEQARLFQPFEQVDGGTTRKFGGTGLGLAICRQLVDLMGGRIGVNSRKGAGATFWFEAPLAGASAMEPTEPTPEPTAPSRSLSILVVDDNETNRTVARQVFTRLGHDLEEAEDGQQAIAKLSGSTYDLVLMDCQMPGMDGYEATRRIRSGTVSGVNPRVPIVGLTAYALPEERERGLAAGMDEYVAKPFKPQQIQRMLAKLDLTEPMAPARREESEATHYDWEQIALLQQSRTANGQPLMETLFAIFRERMPELLTILKEGVKSRRVDETTAQAHQLGGSAANIGAPEVKRRANDLEKSARAGDWAAAERALSALAAEWDYLRLHSAPWSQPDEDSGR